MQFDEPAFQPRDAHLEPSFASHFSSMTLQWSTTKALEPLRVKRKTVGKYITKKECKGCVKGKKRDKDRILRIKKYLHRHTDTHTHG